MKKKHVACVALIVIALSSLVAGCMNLGNQVGPNPSPSSAGPISQHRTLASSSNAPLPSHAVATRRTSSAASARGASGARLRTTVAPESNADSWLLTGIPIRRGSEMRVFTELYSPSEHKNICGAVNYYIDDRAAGGDWHISKGVACEAISGWLRLSPADTMRLSRGIHTLKIGYLGNARYAPSQYVARFTVTDKPSSGYGTRYVTPPAYPNTYRSNYETPIGPAVGPAFPSAVPYPSLPTLATPTPPAVGPASGGPA